MTKVEAIDPKKARKLENLLDQLEIALALEESEERKLLIQLRRAEILFQIHPKQAEVLMKTLEKKIIGLPRKLDRDNLFLRLFELYIETTTDEHHLSHTYGYLQDADEVIDNEITRRLCNKCYSKLDDLAFERLRNSVTELVTDKKAI